MRNHTFLVNIFAAFLFSHSITTTGFSQTYELVDLSDGAPSSGANAINSLGHVGRTQAILFKDGGFIDLGTTLPPEASASINDLNDQDVAVGQMRKGQDEPLEAVLFANGEVLELQPLIANATTSIAWGINNQGTVVGSYVDVDGIGRAFVYDGVEAKDLGIDRGDARGINELGDIVGSDHVTGTPNRIEGWLLSDGVMTPLGNLGGTGTSAFALKPSSSNYWDGIAFHGTRPFFLIPEWDYH